jgi:hypothetical protein
VYNENSKWGRTKARGQRNLIQFERLRIARGHLVHFLALALHGQDPGQARLTVLIRQQSSIIAHIPGLNTPLVQDNSTGSYIQVCLNPMMPSSQCVWDAILTKVNLEPHNPPNYAISTSKTVPFPTPLPRWEGRRIPSAPRFSCLRRSSQ